ncbi:Transposase DDE domain protein [Botrimarina colliarenosi]|uniref:Transposase DDE domain protein n=1 Tax=Botrimarina colliarenosi TaxID=2528001 RepID=A0A5C6A0E9_9BACT|nr:transposase [Botrimarina colliarenosi]TWT92013.1 Transposase DDE domain protein [Botrimarina colliarenosi]
MELVLGFAALLQPFAVSMTTPTFLSFATVATGWVLASRRTVTRMILAAGDSADKHYSSYHRVFSAARWSLERVGLAVLDLVTRWVEGDVLLALDDTLARKRGLKMFGCGMHHDPLISTRNKAVMNWGHSWVVLGVIVELPFRPGHFYCLPVLFRLYLNKKEASKRRRVYRTRPELAVEMLGVLCQHDQGRRFHVVADSAYGSQSVPNHLPSNCDLTSRLLMDARLYSEPPVRQPRTQGRPRKRGQLLPTPAAMLQERCRRLTFAIYGRSETARIADCEARVHKAPDKRLRIVAVEPLTGGRKPQAFYPTRHDASAERVIAWYASRWSIEVAFHDSKQHLGFEQPQGWSRKSVQRTAPVAMLLYSLVVLWFAEKGYRSYQPLECPWYTSKAEPSLADMLATLRRLSVRQKVLSLALRGPGSRKVQQLLENAYANAA